VNITSYNITDVAYHYIGLRALSSDERTAGRRDQLEVIRRGVLKYVEDRALRLMLPEPRGTFESVAPKICQELIHFGFARLDKGTYVLTVRGREILSMFTERRFRELRRAMIVVHLETYDNLAAIVRTHMEKGSVWRPIVEAQFASSRDYLVRLLEPTFEAEAGSALDAAELDLMSTTAKGIEDTLSDLILRRVFPGQRLRLGLFRGIVDRLTSLRLINVPRAQRDGCEFAKSYSPSVSERHRGELRPWHEPITVILEGRNEYNFYLADPDMAGEAMQETLLQALNKAFSSLKPIAGYYDLPDARDRVCELMLIPEAAFDDGVNGLLDRRPSPITVSLQYERITGRRRPLVRTGTAQISNLIRST
jgi:hypothetical protein